MKAIRLNTLPVKPALARLGLPLVLALAGLFTGGCAGIMTQKFPTDAGRIQVLVLPTGQDYESEHHGVQDQPLGVYRIKDSNFFVSNVQGDDDLAGTDFFFGAIGDAIVSGDIAGSAKKQVKDFEGHLNLDICAMAKQSVADAMAKGAPTTEFTMSPQDTSLQITPSLVLSARGQKTARLWVVLKACLADNNFDQIEWKCRYIAGLGKPRAFQGKGGWDSLPPKAVQAEVLADTNEAVRVMMLDLAGGLKGDKALEKDMMGCWVFYKNPRQARVRVYASTDKEDIVQPLVGDKEYFAGVNILPKDFAWEPDTP